MMDSAIRTIAAPGLRSLCRLLGFLGVLAATPSAAFAQGEAILFRNVNIVPMDDDRVLHDQDVLVREGMVTKIGTQLDVAGDVTIIEGHHQAWLAPGLADMHVHSDTREDLAMYLANGITLIGNMGGARSNFVVRVAAAVEAGTLAGPHILSAFIVDGSSAYGHFVAKTPAEARSVVGLARTNGYKFIKVYNTLSPETFQALAQEGKRLGMPIVGHSVDAVGLPEQLEAGQALVAHAEEFFYSFFSAPGTDQTDDPPPVARIPEAVAIARKYKVAVGADLVTYGTIADQIGKPEVIKEYLSSAITPYVSPADRAQWARSGYVGKTANLKRRYAFLEQMLKAMADSGVELLAGTDAPTVPGIAAGYSLHDNFDRLSHAGLTPYQILASATRSPGVFVQRVSGGPKFGTVAAGSRADLILTASNPLDGLATLRRPIGVMVAGKWYASATLEQLAAQTRDTYNIGANSHD
jgi:imidazolonepropionase-like amidohydrolase